MPVKSLRLCTETQSSAENSFNIEDIRNFYCLTYLSAFAHWDTTVATPRYGSIISYVSLATKLVSRPWYRHHGGPICKVILIKRYLSKNMKLLYIIINMKVVWYGIAIGSIIGLALILTLTKTRDNADDDLIVQLVTPNGKIKGHILKSEKNKDFYAFQEIPFAQPPTGVNRMQEPKPAEGWNGVLETTKNTKICVQPASMNETKLYSYTKTEDCLYLNVYTPVKPSSGASLPVYVWIYGGGFITGDATMERFNPKHFMDRDIVVVSMNYRLGAIGFLTTDDINLPGNLGLKDQQLAIQWTVQNVQLFGGDPKKITVGGESAGAVSASYQLLSKKNQGLVRGFIQESGTALNTAYQPDFREMAFQLAKLLNDSFDSTDTKDLREVLLQASTEDIMIKQAQVMSNLTNGLINDVILAPIIEDENNPNALITGPMLQDFHDGNFNVVPTLIGFNSEEGLVFMGEPKEGLAGRAKKYDDDPSLLITTKINVTDRLEAGKELKKLYTNSTFEEDIGAFVRFTSAAEFVRPSMKQAEECSKYATVYVYEFAYSYTLTTVPGTENVGHASELPYFWGLSSIDYPILYVNATIQNQLLILWTNFIKFQNPTPETDDIIGVTWPKLDREEFAYLNINETLEIRTNPKQYKEVKSVLDKYIVKPYVIY